MNLFSDAPVIVHAPSKTVKPKFFCEPKFRFRFRNRAMPSVAVKLYSAFYKLLLKHRLTNRIESLTVERNQFGVTSRPEEKTVTSNPSFTDGVATKDIHIDPLTSLSIRIFLPESALNSPVPDSKVPFSKCKSGVCNNGNNNIWRSHQDGGSAGADKVSTSRKQQSCPFHQNSFGPTATHGRERFGRNSYGGNDGTNGLGSRGEDEIYSGYSPSNGKGKKLPIMLQFHGGGWVGGSNDSVANDIFCRRIAKLCDVIVIAVGYRLAPENRYPAAFEDGLTALNWLGKQANLAECNKSIGNAKASSVVTEFKKLDVHKHIVDTFGASMVEPWLAAHGDPSRCVLLGVSCGANIADYVAQKAVEAGKLLEPVKVVAQVLMYPFFIGEVPTDSETKLANSYFYDKAMCMLAWKLFLPEEEFSLDHPAANPLLPDRGPPLKRMPPTLTVVAEHDWMRDRAIAYSVELRKVNVDAPLLEYKDSVHEFATLELLLKSSQAQVCSEDIAIWVKKYISLRGHEFSY